MILAAFTVSDGAPASQRFVAEVATHPDFVDPLAANLVFLRIDLASGVARPEDVGKQYEYEVLRTRCGVDSYPAIVLLNAAGEMLATADLSHPTDGMDYRNFVIGAVTGAIGRAEAKRTPPMPESPTPLVAPALPAADSMVGAAMSSAAFHLMLGLAGGATIAVLILWWLWRAPRLKDPKEPPPRELLTGLTRGSIPTAQQLATWPADRLQLLVASMFEAGGYEVRVRKQQPDELELTRTEDPAVRVIACCRPGSRGPAHAKAIRELHGSLVAEGVANGWFVALAGFSNEARLLAEERGITLMDGAELLKGLNDVPKLALMRAFNRAGA
jgi:hypothetical protein